MVAYVVVQGVVMVQQANGPIHTISDPGCLTAVITEMAVAKISVKRRTMEFDAPVRLDIP